MARVDKKDAVCHLSFYEKIPLFLLLNQPDKLEFVCVINRSMLLNSIFLFLTRFNPSKKTITHTAEPRVAFIITISVSVIPSNDTSIERCNANIETKASAKDMFRSVIRVADELRRAFMSFIVASVILVKVYAANAIITII